MAGVNLSQHISSFPAVTPASTAVPGGSPRLSSRNSRVAFRRRAEPPPAKWLAMLTLWTSPAADPRRFAREWLFHFKTPHFLDLKRSLSDRLVGHHHQVKSKTAKSAFVPSYSWHLPRQQVYEVLLAKPESTTMSWLEIVCSWRRFAAASAAMVSAWATPPRHARASASVRSNWAYRDLAVGTCAIDQGLSRTVAWVKYPARTTAHRRCKVSAHGHSGDRHGLHGSGSLRKRLCTPAPPRTSIGVTSVITGCDRKRWHKWFGTSAPVESLPSPLLRPPTSQAPAGHPHPKRALHQRIRAESRPARTRCEQRP